MIWALSLSQTIQKNKKEYYQQLSAASQHTVSITDWISYFVQLTYEAQLAAKSQVSFVLKKSQFWQEKIFRQMFSVGYQGFEGGISAQKYAKIANCSKATATRDLTELLTSGWIKKLPGSGRSSRYEIIF